MKRPNKTAEPGGVWASSQFSEGRGEGSTHRANLCELGEDGLPPLLLPLENGYKATDVEVLIINSGGWRDGCSDKGSNLGSRHSYLVATARGDPVASSGLFRHHKHMLKPPPRHIVIKIKVSLSIK